jgi:hypothetical protein
MFFLLLGTKRVLIGLTAHTLQNDIPENITVVAQGHRSRLLIQRLMMGGPVMASNSSIYATSA